MISDLQSLLNDLTAKAEDDPVLYATGIDLQALLEDVNRLASTLTVVCQEASKRREKK